MRNTLRPLVAEFIGVFTLVFVGAGAVITDAYRTGVVGLTGIALAHGLAYAIAVTGTSGVSGGHLNPAVTLGLLSVGRVGPRQAALYVLAQLLGAVFAALVLLAIFPEMAGTVTQLGSPRLAPAISFPEAVLIEAVITFFLAFAVMATAVDPAAPKVGGFAIGLAVAMGFLAAGPLTGAAMNPARAFGPAFVSWTAGTSGAWMAQLAFWLGPVLGAVAAIQLYERLLLKRDAA